MAERTKAPDYRALINTETNEVLGEGMMAKTPCADCEIRMEQMERSLSRQEHLTGLKVLEIVREMKDRPMPGNWLRVTNYECTQCGLGWKRVEERSGALNHYESSFSLTTPE